MLCTIWKDTVLVCIVQYLSILYITLYNNLLLFFRNTWVNPQFLVGFVFRIVSSLVFCVVFCGSLLVLLSFVIVLSLLLRFTDSDYSFWYLQTLLTIPRFKIIVHLSLFYNDFLHYLVSHLLTLRVYNDVFPETHSTHQSIIEIKCKKKESATTCQCRQRLTVSMEVGNLRMSKFILVILSISFPEKMDVWWNKANNVRGFFKYIYVQWSCINIWSHSGIISTACAVVNMCIVYISNEIHIIIVCNVYICFI